MTRMRILLQILLRSVVVAAAAVLVAGPVWADNAPRVNTTTRCDDEKTGEDNTALISLEGTSFNAFGEVTGRADDGTKVSICWATEFPDKIIGKGSQGRIDQKRESLVRVGFDCDDPECSNCTSLHTARPERGKIVGKVRDEFGSPLPAKCRASASWNFEDSFDSSFEQALSDDQATELVEAYAGRKDVLVKDGKKARISIRHKGAQAGPTEN